MILFFKKNKKIKEKEEKQRISNVKKTSKQTKKNKPKAINGQVEDSEITEKTVKQSHCTIYHYKIKK